MVRSRKRAIELNRTHYKTGKECSRGHKAARLTSNGRCTECNKTDKVERRNTERRVTFAWLQDHHHKQIQLLHTKCKDLNKLHGPKSHHVDHVVPLRGKNVTGLNVPWNLEVVPSKPNLKKGNRFNEQ